MVGQTLLTESVTTDPKTMQTQLFRGAVVDTLPGGIQSKLANVPGLDMMSMGRNTKAHQETKKALDKQGTEVTRELAQTSLEQTKEQKRMRVVKSGPEDSDEARSHGHARKRSDTPSSAPVVVERPRQTGQGRGRPQPGGNGQEVLEEAAAARFRSLSYLHSCGPDLAGHISSLQHGIMGELATVHHLLEHCVPPTTT
ncbi:hypothetical protein DPEC_G00220480 [Dallia pectoralis]|uniref:Uncharacterized protein n=1 Tax=Dallia pectoralis TaxID=75939 RepID=A0ACC2G3M8_DALPE|nr:hypothetical protein DPEC_G00220480 [Dallia pectoralis]